MKRCGAVGLAVVCVLLLSCGGGGGGGGGDGGGGGGGGGGLTLETYDAGFFSLKKPQGWEVSTGGVCTTFGFVARDPANPARQIFYFGSLGPVYTSQEQKDFDWYVTGGNFDIYPWLDAPVVSPLTPASFLTHWPQLADMDSALSFMAAFPQMDEVSIVSDSPQTPVMPSGQTSLLRGVFRQGQDVGEGQFYATSTPVPFGMGDYAYGNIVLGATTEAGQFEALEPDLVECLESFTVTDAYIDFCVQHQQALWNAVAVEGQILRETSDMIYDGWQARTRIEDVSAYRYTDAYRDVDRLYDPSTGEVYLAESGWYDANRDALQMNYLENLGDASLPTDTLWDLYRKTALSQSAIH